VLDTSVVIDHGVMFWLTSPKKTEVLYVSPGAEQIWGPPEVWAEFQRLAAGGVPKVFENPILTKAGHERHIMWQNNQVRMHGRIVATISFGNDITESRGAGQAPTAPRSRSSTMAMMRAR
jgi:hypothetical protein